MRITTQMLNETARKSGLPFTCNTLLNQVSQNDTGNALLSALNKNNKTSLNTSQKNSYEKLKKSADQLLSRTEKFTAEDGSSLLDKFQEGGENKDIYTSLEDMVRGYNNTLKELQTLPGTLNDFYARMLRQAATENKEALSDIGITVSKDGTLNADTEKMKGADLESLKKVLSGPESFVEKTGFLASRISDNAAANLNSSSWQYNAAGDTYSALLNRYDFWS